MVCNHLLKGMCGCPPDNGDAPAIPSVVSTSPPPIFLSVPPEPRQPVPPANSPQRRPPPTGPREKIKTKKPQTPWKPTLVRKSAQELAAEHALELLDQDPLLLLKMVEPAIAKVSFAEFFRQAWKELEPGTELVWNWHIDLMCTVMQAVFMDWLRAKRNRSPGKYRYANKIRNVDLNVPPGSSKPVSVEGLVVERKRGLVRLAEISIGDFVLTHRGRFRRVMAVHEQGVLQTIELTTQRGRVLVAAPDHPVLTSRGWIEAGNVTTRDHLAIVMSEEAAGTATIPVEEARLIGYLLGDGCLADAGTARFTNQDPETIADFHACAPVIGLTSSDQARPKNYKGSGVQVVALNAGDVRGGVKAWVTKHDIIGKNSFEKRVPTSVMQGNEDVIANYLAAYWACDGGISDRRDIPRAGRVDQTTQSVRIDATSVSEGMARDHQALLQRLGMNFTLRKRVAKLTRAMVGKSGARIGEDYTSWHLSASDQDTCAKFMQVVTPHIRHEKRTRAEGLMRRDFDRVLHPDQVAGIRDAGIVECRCLTVDEDESFVYQGVAVHNSALIARSFQAWCWLHLAAMKFLALSVNDDATMRDARATRELIRTKWYLDSFKPNWKIKSDQDAISNFGNNAGGDRISMPIKSEIVGLRADVILVDDANNPKKVHNKAERDEINELWDTTIFNRVNDMQRSLRIGIQQRTHVLDWTGHIIETQGLWSEDNLDGWLHVVIPAEFEAERKFVMPKYLIDVLDTPLEGFEALPMLRDAGIIKFVTEDPRTAEGESIDEVRMPKSVLEGERKRWSKSGSYAGQMQQRPSLAEGAMINRGWWGFCRLAGGVRDEFDGLCNDRPRPAHCIPRDVMEAHVVHAAQQRPGKWDFDWMTISVDPAAKKTEKGSNYGMLVVAGKGGRRFVLDDRTVRGAFHEILDILVEMIIFWQPDTLLIEPKAAGPDLMDTLRERMGSGDVPMVAIEECEPGNSDKEMRLEAAMPYIKNGMVYLLDGAPWLEEFVYELSMFPNGPYNDRVDALTQVLNSKRAGDDDWPSF